MSTRTGRSGRLGAIESRLLIGARRRRRAAVEAVRPGVIRALQHLAIAGSARRPRGGDGGRRSRSRAGLLVPDDHDWHLAHRRGEVVADSGDLFARGRRTASSGGRSDRAHGRRRRPPCTRTAGSETPRSISAAQARPDRARFAIRPRRCCPSRRRTRQANVTVRVARATSAGSAQAVRLRRGPSRRARRRAGCRLPRRARNAGRCHAWRLADGRVGRGCARHRRAGLSGHRRSRNRGARRSRAVAVGDRWNRPAVGYPASEPARPPSLPSSDADERQGDSDFPRSWSGSCSLLVACADCLSRQVIERCWPDRTRGCAFDHARLSADRRYGKLALARATRSRPARPAVKMRRGSAYPAALSRRPPHAPCG